MYHRLETLAGRASGEDEPALVSRLWLNYDENPFVTTLVSAQQMAFEQDTERTPVALTPLHFRWQTFQEPENNSWESVEMGNLNALQPWQYLDLTGEGIAGVLCQNDGAWWYREPVREVSNSDQDAVVLALPRRLPSLPVLREGGSLVDLDGDGRPEWVITGTGTNGYYAQDNEASLTWQRFTPLSALPVEYTHPRAQLADLTGNCFADLVLIGPRSVRLYAREGEQWQSGQTMMTSAGVTLPVPGADPAALVAFSDLPGSGQQHLVQVKASGVTYWPNLGHHCIAVNAALQHRSWLGIWRSVSKIFLTMNIVFGRVVMAGTNATYGDKMPV